MLHAGTTTRFGAFLALLFLVACPAGETDGPTDAPACDGDGDGVASIECGGLDCDDEDSAVFPGAPERCNGVDDNCDGETRWEADLACAPCEAAGWFADLVAAPDDEARRATLVEAMGDPRCRYAQATEQMFLQLDKLDGTVTCVYTGEQVEVGSDKPDGSVMNTEHTWPRSLGADSDPERCDLHHLYPTMADANQERGNKPFGEISGSGDWSEGGSKATDSLFEPRDDHKGNVGRSMLYFALRYGYDLSTDEVELYERWSADDPVTDTDLQRSATIARWQGADNPYVVCHAAAGAF